MIDDESEAEEELDPHWAQAQRLAVAAYLSRQRVPHGELPLSPAWHVAPYVGVWDVPGRTSGERSFWAIAGDLPTDFVSADTLPNARSAVLALAERWLAVAGYMAKGLRHPTISIGSGERSAELASLLQSRATLLADWARDDELW